MIVFSQTGNNHHQDDEEESNYSEKSDRDLGLNFDEENERQYMGDVEKHGIIHSPAEPETHNSNSQLLGSKELTKIEPKTTSTQLRRPRGVSEAKLPSPQFPSPPSSSSSPAKTRLLPL